MYTCQYMHLHTCALTFTSVHALIKRGSILIKEGRAGQMSFRGTRRLGQRCGYPGLCVRRRLLPGLMSSCSHNKNTSWAGDAHHETCPLTWVIYYVTPTWLLPRRPQTSGIPRFYFLLKAPQYPRSSQDALRWNVTGEKCAMA